jgi:hypothetical protein
VTRSTVYRTLVRNGLIVPKPRRRSRREYRRWEHKVPMELWQLDVTASAFLTDGTEVKIVTPLAPQGPGRLPRYRASSSPARGGRAPWRRLHPSTRLAAGHRCPMPHQAQHLPDRLLALAAGDPPAAVHARTNEPRPASAPGAQWSRARTEGGLARRQ